MSGTLGGSPMWNPWHGCVKYSEGCANCYMFYLDKKHGHDGGQISLSRTGFDLPLRKDRSGAYKIAPGSSVMVCMTSDFFLPEADEWRPAAWDVIRSRPDLTFWLQTKRAPLVRDRLPADWGGGWPHVRLCFTAENQKRADERLPILMELPFAYKSVMCAPILSAIDLEPWLASGQIREVLADGENYEGERPCRYEWIESLRDQCARHDIPFRFCGTGNVFIKDGKTYRIPRAYHRVQAIRSGLQYPLVDSDVPIRRKCASCPRRDDCGGCRNCGRC